MKRENKPAGGPRRRDVMLAAGGVAAGAVLASRTPAMAGAAKPAMHAFALTFDGPGLTSLRASGDAFDTDYLEPGQALGHVALAYRRDGSAPWHAVDTASLTPARLDQQNAQSRLAEYEINDESGPALGLTLRLGVADGDLAWQVALTNRTSAPLEIGDLALPLPFHTEFKAKQPATSAVLKHSFVSGHGSFLFWMRSNSVGPYLVMTPERETHFEYWQPRQGARQDSDSPVRPYRPYQVFIHAAATGETMKAEGGRWRQPLTSLTLGAGETRRFGARFTWADSYAGVRDALVSQGGIDVEVAQGMTLPTDLPGRIALRTLDTIEAIEAEHPDQTTITPLGQRNGRHIYKLRFRRLGENLVTIRHGNGRATHLEFFATEPVETLIAKRAAFIAAHQHRDPTKWYNGLLAEWNQETQTLLGPDNYDRIKGWRIYEVSCDDPGLSKPAYLASKNAEHPVQAEVAALDDYVEHFVWGGLQRTTEEEDSYALYGIPDWKKNRDSPDPGPKGRQHYWRPYDYPHIIAMYLGLYRVATRHPAITTRLDAATYLERAYGTTRALFTIPMKIEQWSAYETGFYNEVVIPELIDALDAAGKTAQAAELRGHWVRKVDFFVNGKPDLFGSEYPFDSTGFESTQALARYALDHAGQPGFPVTRAAARRFADAQIAANLFCRGTIEPAYYYLGSDYRAAGGDAFTLTYMAQMGGWALADHALNDAEDGRPHLRLAWTSFMSAWALVNSGTAESGYGYWYPGQANDGASGGGFEPASHGTTWLGQPHHRGSWYYSSESDLGFCGALRMAATLVSDDPVFGRFCFGGTLVEADGWLKITPRDGVRRRLHARLQHARLARQHLDLEVQGARFAPSESIAWHPADARLRLTLDGEAQRQPPTLRLRGLPKGRYQVTGGGAVEMVAETAWVTVTLPTGVRKVSVERV
ncbi:DUF5695 domain-containing protein [Nitrospirillum sp. BR 11163]|uniref:DUF5695 domain-containing protein n=1 Tax=Nitrospirillum sp. BR 11163 TaxID=3104323 RepID=UPI002AFF6D4A|nr:DUF5695 domain-containing protein [Nitrospirillum sp. BR 11163]MEA1672279.1 DUF5695 domain-containing protein [Nitrospirillum sp. BR 11163]